MARWPFVHIGRWAYLATGALNVASAVYLCYDSNMTATGTGSASEWQRRISIHIAYALIVYTGLQILMVMSVVGRHGASMLPYAGLVILIALVIPLARRCEKRWERLLAADLPEWDISRLYRRDTVAIWLLAIGVPFLLIALFAIVTKLF